MSVLETYINWANSVLSESGGQVGGVEGLQDGQVLCELIDVLDPEANLVMKVKNCGDCTPATYISTALEHMRGQGIRIQIQAPDIIGKDVKAILDVLWAMILHYGIHSIGESVQDRSVGEGKRKLLEWCQNVLNTTFDPSDTLTFILCRGNWLIKLLEKGIQNSLRPSQVGGFVCASQNQPTDIDGLLREIEDLYHIKRDIIKAKDVVEGTVDENTLMIYLSLLQRRMPPANSEDQPAARDDQRFRAPTQDQPVARDDQRFRAPTQDQPVARDDQRFKAPTQDQSPARDDHRLNSPAPAELLHGARPLDAGRSSVSTAGFSHHSLSDATLGDVVSQHSSRECQVFEQSPIQLTSSPEQSPTRQNFLSEQSPTRQNFLSEQSPTRHNFLSEQSPTRQNFSSEHIQDGDECSSETSRDRLAEYLPEAGGGGRDGEDTGYQKRNQKDDHSKCELCNSPRTRDQHVCGDYSALQQRTQLMQGQQNAVQRRHHNHPSVSVSIQYNTTPSNSPDIATRYNTTPSNSQPSPDIATRYNTTHSSSPDIGTRYNTTHSSSPDIGTRYNTTHSNSPDIATRYNTTHSNSPDIATRYNPTDSTRYNKSNPSYVEQPNERIREHRYQDNPREETIRIRRPRDHIKQWTDSIDRLTTISGTDEFGAPVSPLISQHKISLSGRSKSMDAGDCRYKHTTRTKLDNQCPLAARSRSSQGLSTAGAGSQYHHRHWSNTNQTQTNGEAELSTSSGGNISGELDLEDIHRRPQQEAPHVSGHTSHSEYPAVKATNLCRDSTLRTTPPVSLTSHKDHSYVLPHRHEQTILKKIFRSEPPSSGSRVRFQQQKYVRSDHVQESQPAGYETVAPGTPVSATCHRHPSLSPQRHPSLSPQRHTVSSRARSTAGLSTDASWVPHPLYSLSPKCRSPSPQHARPTMDVRKQEVDDRNKHGSVWLDGSAAALPKAASSPQPTGRGINISVTVQDGRLSKTHSVLPGVGLAEISSSPLVDRHYVGNFVDRRDYSPPGIKRGGAGRVPRREAWEQARGRRHEDLSVVSSEADHQSGIIDVLFQEIEILRENVELLERVDPRSRYDTKTQPGSAWNTAPSIIWPTHRGSHEQIFLSDHISTPVSSGQQRALSCPLLKSSRRSKATRSLSRHAARSGIVETYTALNSPATRSGISESKTALNCHSARSGISETKTSLNSPAARSGISETKTSLNRYAANLSLPRPKSNLDTNLKSDLGRFNDSEQLDRPNVDYNQTAHTIKPHIYGDDLSRSFEPKDLVKWTQLISRRDLSKSEVVELKQAVACVLAENDILQAKLTNARQEVHDKLRHTNGVLEDCRHHLSKSQTENMQLRVMLEEEQGRSDAQRSRITELESRILQVQTDNQQLEHELGHTAMLLDDSLARTQPEIDDLKAENWRLVSRLTSVEDQNADLRDEVDMLTDKQTKAVDTMDGLRKCLARTRQEWQHLSDELATFKEHEHKNRVREIIKNYQEKGSQDEWEKEQAGDSQSLSHADAGSGVTRDLYSGPSDGRLPRSLCMSPNNSTARDAGRHGYNRPCDDPEIYPHRRGHVYYSRTRSSHQGRRSSSVPGYSHPLSKDDSFIDPDIPERKHHIQTRPAVDGDIHSSGWRSHGSRSPDRYRSPTHGPCAPRIEPASSSALNSGNSSPCSVQYRLTRSLVSPADVTCAQSQCLPHLVARQDNTTDRQVPASRNTHLHVANGRPDVSFRKSDVYKPTFTSASANRDCKNAALGRHSPPTRLPPGEKVRNHTSQCNRGPLHPRPEAGEMVSRRQEAFDQEDHMITLISTCPHNKARFDTFR